MLIPGALANGCLFYFPDERHAGTPWLFLPALHFQRHRRDIFVETNRKEFPAPSGATSSTPDQRICRPGWGFIILRATFYKDAGPNGA